MIWINATFYNAKAHDVILIGMVLLEKINRKNLPVFPCWNTLHNGYVKHPIRSRCTINA
jgi:hypothetical protein